MNKWHQFHKYLFPFIVCISLVSVFSTGCSNSMVVEEADSQKTETPETTEAEEQVAAEPQSEASVTIDSIIVKFREVRKYGNIAEFTVRIAQEQYETILASETQTVTCLRSPSENN